MAFDSPNKQFIREHIDITYIEKVKQANGNDGLVYLGLPGLDIHDVLAWKDNLKKIIAIEYNENLEDLNEEEKMKKYGEWELKFELYLHNHQYELFFGSVESLICENGKCMFSNKPLDIPPDLSLINLDFCDTYYKEKSLRNESKITKILKREVIEALLMKIRQLLSGANKKSHYILLLLTFNMAIRNQQAKSDFCESFRSIVELRNNVDIKDVKHWHLVVWKEITNPQNKGNCRLIQAPSIKYQGDSRSSQMAHSILLLKYDEENYTHGSMSLKQNVEQIKNQNCFNLGDASDTSSIGKYHQEQINELFSLFD